MTCGDGTGAEGTETGCLLGGKVRMAVGDVKMGFDACLGRLGGCAKWASTKFSRPRAACVVVCGNGPSEIETRDSVAQFMAAAREFTFFV